MELTNGPLGLPGIPQPEIFGYQISTHVDFLIVTLLLALLVAFISKRLGDAPYGLVLKGIREDETFALSLGKNAKYFKTSVFVIGSGLAAIAGAMYAYYVTYIDPTSFTVSESIFMLSIVIVGGAGRLRGPILGAIILVSLPEILRFLDVPNSIAANLRQILYGGLLVGFMMLRPKGIWGQYGFDRT